MQRFQAVLLQVWQEACRHIEISYSTRAIAALLSRHMPIDQVHVRRIDRGRCCVETVAVEVASPAADPPNARTDCSAADLQGLLAWCAEGEVARARPGTSADERLLGTAIPAGTEAEVLAGPLGDPQGLCGLLLLVAPPGHAFTARHEALAQVLLEPFSVALENDRRVREMAALREVAEADKRSLLSRLGRTKLGDTIVGTEAGLKAVMERVELVARSDVPVLIFGETGTGKELLARAIHARSPRAAGPVHRVNCGAIPPELIDSELFGHEKGAFTGAVETRKGWFERADGGTLFLDEIGELPPAAQVRLLRVLQDGWLERVGGHRPVNVDVRMVAATHRDLAGMVAEGKFRQDLWYRIAIFPIVLPPLRERTGDVPALANHFAQRAAVRFGLPRVMPSPADIRVLTSYPWPGNVRELAAVIDRAAILGNGERLEVAKALGIAAGPPGAPVTSHGHASAGPQAFSEIVPLDTAVRRHIEAGLTITKGRIEGPRGAAALLRVNPHTLRARMRKLGIDWRQFREPGR